MNDMENKIDVLILGLLESIEILVEEDRIRISDEICEAVTMLRSQSNEINELNAQVQSDFEEKRKCYFAVGQHLKAITNTVAELDALKGEVVQWKANCLYYNDLYSKAIDERDQLKAKNQKLAEALQTICNGLQWNIENHTTIMNQCDDEALDQGCKALKENT